MKTFPDETRLLKELKFETNAMKEDGEQHPNLLKLIYFKEEGNLLKSG